MAKAAPTTTQAPFTTAPFAGTGAGAAAPGAAPASVSAGSHGGGASAWLPTIATVVLAPALTWAVGQFVLIPQLQKKLGSPIAAEASVEKSSGSHSAEGKAGGKEGAPTFEFQNVVVNLAGTMGTRYLKTTFMVTGADANIRTLFETNKARLTDVTLNVLSSLSLADLEEPGAKNVLREKLVAAYNQALGHKVAEQVYFSDFVVQ
jgi:flagellar FliL protein